MKAFDKAVLKLTAAYTAILVALSVGFSFAFYSITDLEMNRERLPRITIVQGEIPEFQQEIQLMLRARNDAVRQSLLSNLIVINICVLAGGVAISYFLARLNMKPINDALESQGRFVSDASHELRTPLAAIAMENEVLLRKKNLTKEALRAQVVSNLEEVQRLQRLTNYLLELGHVQKITDVEERELMLEQIVSILVENAIKYDPKHREPKVVRTKTEVKVIDKGPGVAEEDLPHIFERFYRADKARTSEGYGLGLALAQSLAERIGARIEVKNNMDAGATFSVIFQSRKLF
jgi:signal transduction histidine kinase